MDIRGLEIIQVEVTPPPLDLTLEEIEALKDELVAYHREFARLYYRVEQAQLRPTWLPTVPRELHIRAGPQRQSATVDFA